jgi:phosphoribosylformylglycinamidine cyclo-ligase
LVRPDSWTIPPIFGLIEREGGIERSEMFRAFNMGVGWVIVCAAGVSAKVLEALHEAGESRAAMIGEVIRGEHSVTYR